MNRKVLSIVSLALLSTKVCAQGSAGIQNTLNLVLVVMLAVVTTLLILLLVFRNKMVNIQNNPTFLELKNNFDSTIKNQTVFQEREKQLNNRISELQSELRTSGTRLDEAKSTITRYEAQSNQQQEEVANRIRDLENSRKALEQERQRIIAEDVKQKEEEKNQRDRIWALHEQDALNKMREVCQKANILLPSYDNTNLPDDFDPDLKPDFMIKLLDQYVVFDPKTSKSQNTQTYIGRQVKETAKKLKSSSSFDLIYRTVFFVVPSVELSNLKEHSYFEQGYAFFVISIEAFEPIATTLKRLEDYEFADKYDPQERENIVNLVAVFEQHIRHQNATNILNTARGLKVLNERQNIPIDINDAIEAIRKNIRIENFKPTELKKLISDPEEQIKRVTQLIKPQRPEIGEKDLQDAQDQNP